MRSLPRMHRELAAQRPAHGGGLFTKSCPAFATLWSVVYQDPPSVGFSRQESWSGLPFPSPGDLPYPGIEPKSPALQADSLPSDEGSPPNQEMLFS